jgi:hypothetical protein
MVMMRGDDADITIDMSTGSPSGHFYVEPGSNHIHLTNPDVDFTRNSPTDELRLAFSIINKDGDSASAPDLVRILVDFASTDDPSADNFARFEIELENSGGTGGGEYNLDDNRYYVVSTQLQDLYITPNFTWNAVTVAKIYVCAMVDNVPSDQYYVALDALRLENVSTVNPIYGMTGYTVVKNTDATTIIKASNTSNYIEFRFSIGVT